jgi:NADH-quinone oxidoreductase subunit J
MVHIIVYTGAIMVLFLFVIMLLNLNKITEPSKTLTTRIAAVTGWSTVLVHSARRVATRRSDHGREGVRR